MDIVVFVDPHIGERSTPLAFRLARRSFPAAAIEEPPNDGVVVVRSGVRDATARVIVRQEVVRLQIVAERELEQLHPAVGASAGTCQVRQNPMK